jgi:alpha-2-macroglobulin
MTQFGQNLDMIVASTCRTRSKLPTSGRIPSMFALIRARLAAACVAALVLAVPFSARAAAEKPFQDSDLADSAVQLEAQIKSDAGAPTKTLPQIRKDADTAFARNDFRNGMMLLGQIVAAQPNDSTTWLRLARTVMQIRPVNDQERVTLLQRASTAAYIAYQRTTNRNEEADSLAFLGDVMRQRELWRPSLDALRLSLEIREASDVRAQYERLRDQYGFRVLDYSVDADTASPRACFQFSEELPGRTDFSPFVVVAGIDKPAVSTTEKQLCVEGLQHGNSYTVTLRAGLPSVVHESLSKSSDFSIYVRDRKPEARFSSTAYVLPRTGQRGIPVISVNTKAVAVEIYRISDRNLVTSIIGSTNYDTGDFQTSLNQSQIDHLKKSRGIAVWSGELAVDAAPINQDVTTAFPIDQAVTDLKAGIYVMVAQPKELKNLDNDYEDKATQWFIVSDLGLTAFTGNDGIHAFVNSLATTDAKKDIEVKLISRSNEVLAARRTDASGHVQFEAGLAHGEGGAEPTVLVANDGEEDFAFLNLTAPAFDLTDRGVSGRPAPNGLDAFVYAERGVYRSGETAYLTALLRDARGAAAPGVPLTFVVERPDGVEYKRTVVPDGGLGGHSLTLPIAASAPTGTWSVHAFTDPKRPAVGETTFLVEDYVPDRIEFDLTSPSKTISKADPATVNIAGRFLYGAPAASLDLDGEMNISVADERAGFAGYEFGLDGEDTPAIKQPLEDLPSTDDSGKATLSLAVDKLPSSTHPLEAKITVRMTEPGGRAVEHAVTLPVAASGNMIGVKPLFVGRSLADGASAGFNVVVVAPNGSTIPTKGLHYELLQVEEHYQFYKRDGSWHFEPVKTTRRLSDGSLDTTDQPGHLALPVNYGHYRLVVSTADGVTTSVGFDAGWYVDASADTPDMLETALDKSEYKPGDTMTVAVTARTAGKLTLNVVGDKLLASQTTDIAQAGVTKVTVPVGPDWGTGAYVVATLRRPLDAPAQRMPGRAIGVQWFAIDRAAKTLAVDIKPPALLRPGTTLHIPVRIDGLKAGDEARVAVAAVDVGILNLTNYKPPSPNDYYLGQRALSADIRDLYGDLIDGMQGARGQIRTGGDSGEALQGPPPSGPPLAFFSGIVTVGADGAADIAFDIPDFAGTVRVMAVAWNKDKVGQATADVTVRDPVVLTATLPRFLLPGDRSTIHLDLDNVEGAPGDYTIAVTAADTVMAGAGATQKLTLAAQKRGAVTVPITANGAGNGTVKVSVSGPSGFALERNYTMTVRSPAQILARRTVKSIAKGDSLTLSSDMFADLVSGTGDVSISVGSSAALDAAGLLAALDRYPYRCSEQITSRAMPLLYVAQLASETNLALATAADQRVREAIEALLTRQDSTGSFGLWGVGGNDVWLDSYVTEFLTRAREKKYAVPDVAFKLAIDHLRNFVANTDDPSKNGGTDFAYALYVLARNGVAPIGDLRYFADSKLDTLSTPIAKAQLAAALALAGDRVRAERVYGVALADVNAASDDHYNWVDYGSTLRDAAAIVTLASESGAAQATVHAAVQRVESARASLRSTSTQEDAWLLLAASAMAKDAGNVSLDVNGETVQRQLYRTLRAGDLKAPVKVTNAGDTEVKAVVTVSGAPVTPEPPASNGFTIERQTYTPDGDAVDPAHVKQNTRLVVVLKVTEAQPQFGRVMVADYLPAGFEIDNPHLVSSGDTGTLSWITDAVEPANSEFRDDRFTAAFERKRGDAAVFTVAYVVRAVAPGTYVQPQARVEDMYRPDRYGRSSSGTVEVTAAK